MPRLQILFFAFSVDLLALAAAAVAFEHGKKTVWLSTVDGMFPPSRQVVRHFLGRDWRLVFRFNDIVVM